MERPNLTGGGPSSPIEWRARRRAVAVAIVLGVAAVHLVRLGTRLPVAWRSVYSSYFSDVVVPLAFYFLLVTQEDRVAPLATARAKAAVVFGAATFAEAAQALGIPLLGRVADPVDVVMYGLGVLLAAGIDRAMLPRPPVAP